MAPPKLILLTPGGPVTEFILQPGANTFGRNETNRHQVSHPSISGTHCQVVWEGETVRVQDLGSTNGTFIDGQSVQDEILRPGQVLRLGSVDMKLEARFPEGTAGTRGTAVRVEVPPLARPMPNQPASPTVATAVSPVVLPAPPKSFFQHLPGVFVYPFSKNGIILLVVGGVLFAVLGFLASFSCLLSVVSTGYLSAYMQRVVSSSAQGEPEMPDFPDLSEWWSDILSPALNLIATMLFCFGPAYALYTFCDRSNSAVLTGSIGLAVLGGLYFPMAWLAVAVTDNLLAMNPLVVVTSIFRVLLPYLVVCLLLGMLVGLRYVSEAVLHDLPMAYLVQPIASVVWFYLLAVEMRILGLLYFTHRERLGWF